MIHTYKKHNNIILWEISTLNKWNQSTCNESVIFSQDANPSQISHNSIIILEEQHFVSC